MDAEIELFLAPISNKVFSRPPWKKKDFDLFLLFFAFFTFSFLTRILHPTQVAHSCCYDDDSNPLWTGWGASGRIMSTSSNFITCIYSSSSSFSLPCIIANLAPTGLTLMLSSWLPPEGKGREKMHSRKRVVLSLPLFSIWQHQYWPQHSSPVRL